MAARKLSANDLIELERLVDKTSLRTVVAALAEISALKAQHLRENWQDRVAARPWDRDANKLETCANKLSMEW